jgi:FtsZ-binding cell division protein ZapB
LLAYDISYQQSALSSGGSANAEANAQQMLQAVVQEMGNLRSTLMQPLQAEIEILQKQREALRQEVQQLEAQRQNAVLTVPPATVQPANQQQMITEFLQVLMGRLQESLTQQVTQTLRGMTNPALPASADASTANLAYATGEPLPGLQSQSDQLIINLDTTLRIVFEALQRDVKTYHDSLAQGVDRMHALGQQSEMMFNALVNHLAQRLGQEASYLVSTQPEAEVLPGSPPDRLPEPPAPEASAAPTRSTLPPIPPAPPPTQNLAFPYAGIELSTQSAAIAANDANFNRWLSSPGMPAIESSGGNLGAGELDIANLNLDNLDLNQIDPQEIDALLDLEVATPSATRLPESLPSAATLPAQTDDIDAALRLLEQFNLESTTVAPTPPPPDQTQAVAISNDAQDEVDEFYASLFGEQAETEATAILEPAEPIAESIDVTILPDFDQPEPPPTVIEPETVIEPPTVIEPELPLMVVEPLIVEPETVVEPEMVIEPEMMIESEIQQADFDLSDLLENTIDPTLGWDVPLEAPTEPAAISPQSEDLFSDFPNILATADVPATTRDRHLATNSVDVSRYTNPALSQDLFAGEFEQAERIEPLTQPDNRAIDASSRSFASSSTASEVDEIHSLMDLFPDVAPIDSAQTDLAQTDLARTDLARTDWTRTETSIAPRLEQTGAAIPPASQELTQTFNPSDVGDLAIGATTPFGHIDDRFVPASPEEILLPIDEPSNEASGLWLDENTLNRLNADLSSLEGFAPSPEAPDFDSSLFDLPDSDTATALPQPEDWSDATLDDFTPSMPVETMPAETLPERTSDSSMRSQTPANPPSAQNQTAAEAVTQSLTLEGMDDLFADLPSTPPPAAKSSSLDFRLEGIEALFDDTPTSAIEMPEMPPAEQSPGFTLEGMNDLFADLADPFTASPIDSPDSEKKTP